MNDRDEKINQLRSLDPPITFEEIGTLLGITRQRVHQIWKRSEKKKLIKLNLNGVSNNQEAHDVRQGQGRNDSQGQEGQSVLESSN